jgi:uncharacterized damage-inducible protein DinB
MDAANVVKKEKKILGEQLVALLDSGNAHMTFDPIVAKMPLAAANTRPPHFNYTPWHLLEHMRRAQLDILKFIKDPDYASPPYEEFWPDQEEKATAGKWRRSVSDFRAGLDQAMELARAPETDFFSPLPHAPDYTIFRELLLIADHNAYHLGELITLRQFLQVPPPEKW